MLFRTASVSLAQALERGKVEDGRGGLGACGIAPFPVPAHQTGRADFPHPAFRLVSPRSTRRGPSSVRAAEAVGDGRRAQQHRSASVFAAGKASSEASGYAGVFQAHRQSPILGFVQKRTRSKGPFLRQHYPASTVVWPSPTPVRPAASLRRWGCQPQSRRVSPDYPHHLSNVPCPLPRRIETGAVSIASPLTTAFPVSQAGRHPHLHFRGLLRLHSRYGPLDCSTAQGGLCHEASSPASCPTKPLVSYQSNRQLSGWNLPPLVIRAVGAHRDARGPEEHDKPASSSAAAAHASLLT